MYARVHVPGRGVDSQGSIVGSGPGEFACSFLPWRFWYRCRVVALASGVQRRPPSNHSLSVLIGAENITRLDNLPYYVLPTLWLWGSTVFFLVFWVT